MSTKTNVSTVSINNLATTSSIKIKPRNLSSKKILYSFQQWCLDNDRGDILDRWDYELNVVSPKQVAYKSNKKYYFKCPDGIHESELRDIQYLSSGRVKELTCKKCRSFAQYIINTRGKDFLDDIWSSKNEKTPWDYAAQSNTKVWIVCDKDFSHVYKVI